MDSKKTLVLGLIFVLVAGGGYVAYRDYSKRQAEATVASQRKALYFAEKRRLLDRIGDVKAEIRSAKMRSRGAELFRSGAGPEVQKRIDAMGGLKNPAAANVISKRRERAELEGQLADLTRSYLEKQ